MSFGSATIRVLLALLLLPLLDDELEPLPLLLGEEPPQPAMTTAASAATPTADSPEGLSRPRWVLRDVLLMTSTSSVVQTIDVGKRVGYATTCTSLGNELKRSQPVSVTCTISSSRTPNSPGR
jgi:hypothetical protein